MVVTCKCITTIRRWCRQHNWEQL